MDNLKEPACPFIVKRETGVNQHTYTSVGGFTKLELASLMIAQGFAANNALEQNSNLIAEWSVAQAKAVLEEANK